LPPGCRGTPAPEPAGPGRRGRWGRRGPAARVRAGDDVRRCEGGGRPRRGRVRRGGRCSPGGWGGAGGGGWAARGGGGRGGGGRRAEVAVVAAVDELEQLDRELDVADAAPAPLDLSVGETLAGQVSLGARLHGPHGADVVRREGAIPQALLGLVEEGAPQLDV